MPTEPVREHDWQVPVQALAQQTPCAQKPELHSTAVAHVPPMGFLPQLMLLQLLGEVQSAVVAQVVRQAALVPHI